jgi:hypothetical protein
VAHHVGFGHDGQLSGIRARIGHIAVQVREVPGMRASRGDQDARALLLSPDDALASRSGCFPGIPGSRKKAELMMRVILVVVHVLSSLST